MSQQHRRPLFAFLLIAIACAAFMGYSLRAEALIGVLAHGETRPLVKVTQRVLLGIAESEPDREELTRSATVGEGDQRSVAPLQRVKRDEPAGESAASKPGSRTAPGRPTKSRSTEERDGHERATRSSRPRDRIDTERRRKQPPRTADPGDSDNAKSHDESDDRRSDDRSRPWGSHGEDRRSDDRGHRWGDDGNDRWSDDRGHRWGSAGEDRDRVRGWGHDRR